MTATPVVSVVLPTYNRETLLPRAIDSILAQTFDGWEIIVIDDGSTDRTADIIADYARMVGDRIVHLEQPNLGVNRARNRGIDACRGEFVAFLDSDDEFLPTKLERQLDLFRLRPELGLIYGDYAFVDLDGERFESAFDTCIPIAREVPHERIAPNLCVCRGRLFDSLIRGYFIATIVGMVRRGVLGDTIRFPRSCSYSEEWLFYLRVARTCLVGFVDEPLALHHFTKGSLARTDKQRNTERLGALLETMDAEFVDLSREQRTLVHRQIARNKRQMGYDALREQDGEKAIRCFASSLRYERRIESVYRLGHAVLLRMLGRTCGQGRRRSQSQDLPLAVR